MHIQEFEPMRKTNVRKYRGVATCGHGARAPPSNAEEKKKEEKGRILRKMKGRRIGGQEKETIPSSASYHVISAIRI